MPAILMHLLAAALYGFIINLVSMGLGPLSVGMLSDYLQPDYGVDSLRYAILCVVIIATFWAAVHFLLAARHLRGDLASTVG